MPWHSARGSAIRKEGRDYRLPTEAEGDTPVAREPIQNSYAAMIQINWCRSPMSQTSVMRRNAREHGRSFLRTMATVALHPLGNFVPMPLDSTTCMETPFQWCSDGLGPDDYGISPVNDPTGPAIGLQRVMRGSSFRGSLIDGRCDSRSLARPNANYSIGDDRDFASVRTDQPLRWFKTWSTPLRCAMRGP